ncbi:hypothetical protein E1180_01590 [Roseibium denhamense]|uniref:PilZ domain-containing protein n=1 Tax=Roseibium denhamense TaxID=76305 RepID=A0ABY1P3F6_9HYPH|nr:hypothetical protein [Roseibium denhamense]MTI04209.1 hypothetical protein [Roseibium denhamense]SMP25457.1 hypothetical protein SAMN06265374_2562 [Roseibium denhamense]
MSDPVDPSTPIQKWPVLVLDFETLDCEDTIARDVSRHGCRVRARNMRALGKPVGVRLIGIDTIIRGRICELLSQEVIVAFEEADQAKLSSKPRTHRKVSIKAQILAGPETGAIDCRIVAASHSGCQLQGEGLDGLPDTITLKISGLAVPVAGRVLWRAEKAAGVQMMWQFPAGDVFMVDRITPPSLLEKMKTAGPDRPPGTNPFAVRRPR